MSREPVFSLTRKDFRLDWFSGSGAGGQHRNKHQNCVRITHIETGITAQCVDHRDRPSNQRVAFQRLIELLKPWIRDQILGKQKVIEKSQEVIRTYNIPDNRVKDHATGLQQSWDEVSGDLSKMIDTRWASLIKEFDS